MVVRGAGLGRKLGFPTANIRVPPRRRLPRGVFRVLVSTPAWTKPRQGACNVGVRPTLDGPRRRHVEVHVPGFRGDLYGRRVRLVFIEKLRSEKRFGSLAALRAQIRRDVAKVKEVGHG